MKLHLSMLERMIELPSKDPAGLRIILDEIGLEVKDLDLTSGSPIFTIETLANRGDTLHALGVGRELSAHLLTSIKSPPVSPEPEGRKTSLPIRRITDKCLKYALLEMSLPSSMELRPEIAQVVGEHDKKRHPIVDILNYVQIEIGQPMHAFDRDKLEGEVSIDLSSQEETIEALDGKTYKVPSGTIVIKDKKKIVAVAGVIGCANSMVTPETSRVAIESACFDPVSVRLSARRMGLSTDASYTFERGSDPEAVVFALRRVIYLASAAGAAEGGQAGHVLGLSVDDGKITEKRKIRCNLGNIKQQINLPRLSDAEIITRLKNLGFQMDPQAVADSDGKKKKELEIQVTVPSWRIWDIKNPEDLVEEFARVHGLNRVKLELPPLDSETPETDPYDLLLERVNSSLIGTGFIEVITRSYYSAEDAKILAALDPEVLDRHVSIKNALDSGYSHMRVSAILHFAKLAAFNHRKGVSSVKVYEIHRNFGLVFGERDARSPYEYERDTLSLGASGRWFAHEWRKAETKEQLLFHLKGTLESLLGSIGTTLQVSSSEFPFLHPGYQAAIKAGREICGVMGLLHPSLKDAVGLNEDLVFAELDIQKLIRLSKEISSAEPVDFPAIRRDITLKYPLRELAGKVSRYISDVDPKNLQTVAIVDEFKRPEEDFRRVTFRLTFQSPEKTLEHSEIDAEMEKILGALKEKHDLILA